MSLDLNGEQRRAVEAGDGPVLIVAGPGTGKTKTLTARIAYLIANNKAKPEQILALTFTKKAAEEMQARVRTLLVSSSDLAQGNSPHISTFHALCQELLGIDTPFVSDVQRLVIIKSLSRPKALKSLSARELGLAISRAKNQPEIEDPDMAKLVRAYNKALQEHELRDFDDLLQETYQLLKNDEQKRGAVQTRFRYVLVDEFQDTNRLQYELLRLLLGHTNIFVIGDPNQSIYGFRGASGTIFEQFKKDFPDYTGITLTTNYRSVPQVVLLSNALFKDAANLEAYNQIAGMVRAVQVLNEYSEAAWILSEIQRSIGGGDMLKAVSDDERSEHRRLSDFAVLYRNRSAAATFQKILAESGLPYQIVGDGSPYDQPQVQAVMALMRAVETGEEVSAEGFSGAELRHLTQALHERRAHPPASLSEHIIAALGFEASRDLQQFISTLIRFETLTAAINHLDAIAEHGFYDPSADAITLLTIHASKGLEFPHVFLVATEDGTLPNTRGLTSNRGEEMRLFYVAVTRAKERLEILHAKNRRGQPVQVSPFINKLSPAVLERITDPDMDSQVRRIAKKAAKRSQQSLF